MSELAFTSALEQARLVKAKEVSPVELVDLYLDRIERLDGPINSCVTVAAESARAAAKEAEAQVGGADLPAFHGVPITIKDLQETKGIETTFSCKALAGYIPDSDDHVVAKVKEAGFIILAKTNTSEFGSVPVAESELNGKCRNPWDLERTTGGSSGGAAAGLAAGLTPIAHGADGGGSIRIPASCCGLFGIKPSRGRLSSGPRVGEFWHGFSTSGPMGRSVADAAALLDVMQGYMTGDPYWAPPPARPYAQDALEDPPRLKVAFTFTSPNEIPPHEDVRVATEAAARLIESLGHEVVEADPPWVDPTLAPSFVQLISTGMAVIDFLPHEMLEPLNRFLVESAAGISSIEHMRALGSIHTYVRRAVTFWDDYDVLLTPTLASPPVPVGWMFSDEDPMGQLMRSGQFIPYTAFANISGQPAVSVPLHWNDEGLPIGVQLIGGPADESTLIKLSGQLERAEPWADRRPPEGRAATSQ